MKCPKCGSDLDTGFNCVKCDYKHNQKQLSTTEKMIVIKTDLKEMPKGCGECTHEDVSDNGFYFCKAVNRLDDKTLKYEKCRPGWCPLIEIKEVKE